MASADREPIERLAEEWRERWRRGEQFSADEYIARYPELADQIRELFPAIEQQLKPVAGNLTGGAADRADDLHRSLENRPTEARRASVTDRFRHWCRRNPVVAGLTLTVFVLLACCAVGSTVAAFWLQAERDSAREAEARARKEEEAKTEKLYEAYVAQANASRFSRQPGQRFATLDTIRKAVEIARERSLPPERFDELRTLAIASLALPDWRVVHEWDAFADHGNGGARTFDWDWHHNRCARGYSDGQVSIHDLKDDHEIGHVSYLPGGFWAQFSPGGRFLMAFGLSRFHVWDLGRPNWPVVLDQPGGGGEGFHPDGRHVVFVRDRSSIFTCDLLAPMEAPRLLATCPGATAPRFDPAGTRLAVIVQNAVHILDARTGKLLQRVPQSGTVEAVAWHPRADVLALVCSPHTIKTWDLRRNRMVSMLEGCRSAGIRVAFTPDGVFLVSMGWEAQVRLWNWRTRQQVLRSPGTCSLSFTPDGRMFVRDDIRARVVQLANGAEYRTLVQQTKPGIDVEYWGGAIHPGGRLLAAPMSDGVRMWDLHSGAELAYIPMPARVNATFAASDGLLVNSASGLSFWPIRQAAHAPGELRVGPPELWQERGTYEEVAGNRAGNVLVQARYNDAVVWRRDRIERPIALPQPQCDVRYVDVSPNGALAVCASHWDHLPVSGVNVFNAMTGKLVKHFPVGGRRVAFSPDGKYLALGSGSGSGNHRARILAVGSWADVATGRWGAQTFSPDSRLLAVDAGAGVIRLLEAATGRDKAVLHDPHQDVAYTLRFTPDATRLIAVSKDGSAIHVWDLRLIREQLAKLGLDWDAPPYPVVAASPKVDPLRVTVVGAELANDPVAMLEFELQTDSLRLLVNPFDADLYVERGRIYRQMNNPKAALRELNFVLALAPAHGRARFQRGAVNAQLGRWTQARDDFTWLIERSTDDHEVYRRRAECRVALGDDVGAAGDYAEWLQHGAVDARTLNAVAWRLVGRPADRPAAQLGAADLALPLVQNALTQAPTDRDLVHTLGVAYYRLGRYQDAIETLERLAKRPNDRLHAFELYCLAMCHHKLGAKATAQRAYDDALRWQELAKLTPVQREDLQSMRAEAEAVLGIFRKDG